MLRSRAALLSARDQLASSGLTVSEVLRSGSPATVIAEMVKELEIDLLAMGAYGHSHIREFIVGSTTSKMVRTCAVPVLMFRH